MLKIRQYLCRHKGIKVIATNKHSSQNLWQCPKCKVYVIQHWGLGLYYFYKNTHIGHWKYKKSLMNEGVGINEQ